MGTLTTEPNELDRLFNSAKDWATEAKSPATRKTYKNAWKHYSGWCETNSVVCLPSAVSTVTAYLVHLFELGRKPATIEKILVAISQAHKLAGHETPTTNPAVRETLKGYKREVGTAQAQKKPVDLECLLSMLTVLPETTIGIRDRAILLLGFAGGFRRSELVGLDVSDIEFEGRGAIVTVRRSKTDQEGQGRRVGIPFGKKEQTCPVRAVREWMDRAETADGPLFLGMDRHGRVADERLSDRGVARIIKRTAKRAGYDPAEFSGHSLRVGLKASVVEEAKESLFSNCASSGLL